MKKVGKKTSQKSEKLAEAGCIALHKWKCVQNWRSRVLVAIFLAGRVNVSKLRMHPNAASKTDVHTYSEVLTDVAVFQRSTEACLRQLHLIGCVWESEICLQFSSLDKRFWEFRGGIPPHFPISQKWCNRVFPGTNHRLENVGSRCGTFL